MSLAHEQACTALPRWSMPPGLLAFQALAFADGAMAGDDLAIVAARAQVP
jgi:hypothetical protein